jgi:nicotinate-nucleotide adenylyltransferase
MRVGLYFGSFNPIHHGHLIVASYTQQCTNLDQVWLVVSPKNPFKENNSLLNEYHRLHLVRIALEGEKNIKAADIEFALPRPSYTIDTLTYLEEKYPDIEFGLIMGSDSLQNLEKWKSGNLIMARYPIYVYERPGFGIEKPAASNITITRAPLLEISASLIRSMIRQGKSIRYFVPEAVEEEIMKSGYYRETPSTNKPGR